MFENAKWIWNGRTDTVDQHMEFVDSFKWNGGDVSVSLSVDGDYTLWVNGVYAASAADDAFAYIQTPDSVLCLNRNGESEAHQPQFTDILTILPAVDGAVICGKSAAYTAFDD